MIEDHRQQFARLMMDYAEHENERLVAARAFIPGIIERQTKQIDRDPALALLIEYFKIDPNNSLDHIEAELLSSSGWIAVHAGRYASCD